MRQRPRTWHDGCIEVQANPWHTGAKSTSLMHVCKQMQAYSALRLTHALAVAGEADSAVVCILCI